MVCLSICEPVTLALLFWLGNLTFGWLLVLEERDSSREICCIAKVIIECISYFVISSGVDRNFAKFALVCCIHSFCFVVYFIYWTLVALLTWLIDFAKGYFICCIRLGKFGVYLMPLDLVALWMGLPESLHCTLYTSLRLVAMLVIINLLLDLSYIILSVVLITLVVKIWLNSSS